MLWFGRMLWSGAERSPGRDCLLVQKRFHLPTGVDKQTAKSERFAIERFSSAGQASCLLFYLNLKQAKQPAGSGVCMCTAYSASFLKHFGGHLKRTMRLAARDVLQSAQRPSRAYHLACWANLEAKLAKCFKKMRKCVWTVWARKKMACKDCKMQLIF